MTMPVVASPSTSIPDAGTAAKAAAASPEAGDSFGAMLAQASDTTNPATTDSASASQVADPQAAAAAVSDPSALAAAIANQAALMMQLNVAKPPDAKDAAPAPNTGTPASNDPNQAPAMTPFDVASMTIENPGAPPVQTQAPLVPGKTAATNLPPSGNDSAETSSVASATQGSEPEQTPAPPVASAPAPQTPPQKLASDDAEKNATAANANVSAQETAPQDGSQQPAPQTAAAAPNPSKNEKPARKDSDNDKDGDNNAPPSNAMALTDLSSRVAAQFLAAPSNPAPQSPPAADSKPEQSKPEDFLNAALSAAAQATPKSAPDKSGTPKAAAASDARNASDARSADPNDSRSTAASGTPATAAAAPNTNDALNRGAANSAPPAEHGAKSEPVTAAQTPVPATPTMSTVPNHAAIDPSAIAAPDAQTASTAPDTNVPVRLSTAPSVPGDAPAFDALALRIATRSANGENNFSLRLDPPELGHIEVNLNVRSDGHAQAEVTADKPQTLELLQRDSSSLERALKDAGLNLAGGLAFSLKGEGKSQTWRDAQGSGRGRNLQIAPTDAANANAAITAGAALAGRAYGLSTARLDIRV
ncbi:MAG TPA: flagellar hook-length control protein FliK [Micropepsaceae bacterium]|nr:flagellar hook-length control protein FliK [Micropepsaceae bacterium]